MLSMNASQARCRLPRWPLLAERLVELLVVSLLWGCAGPRIDLDTWRATQAGPRGADSATATSLDARLERVEELRHARKLEEARAEALRLAADHPRDPRALTSASRAESDGVLLFDEDDKHSRKHAAASSLEFAQRAVEAGASLAADRAQLAWALGATTHLQPMFERAAHARRTLDAAHSALQLESDEPTALATLAMVHWRLETLPWIASMMAFGAPDSSLKEAERAAWSACQSVPSRENRLILAKVLIARKNKAGARVALDLALAAPAAYPRDAVLEKAVRALRDELD
jgi:hypothetical protein